MSIRLTTEILTPTICLTSLENLTVKKLSIKRTATASRYVLPIVAKNRIYRNQFSGFTVDDGEFSGCCCNCKEKFCLEYSSHELHSDFFNSFPHNTSRRVCPTDAISNSNENIIITQSKCIGCGICISRCPFSAFAFDEETGKCFVQNNDSKIPDSLVEQEKQIKDFRSLQSYSKYDSVTIPFIEDKALRLINGTDAPEIIVRNFLVNLGFTANSNAQGNQHNRIEFFALVDDKYLIGECETGNDVLSVSRRILDDLAVLVSRHSVNLEDIIPLAVINRLPNKRTDYYEVIEDVNKVLGIQINTITYACLFFLNLFNIRLSIEDFKLFILNRQSSELNSILERFIPNFSQVCGYSHSDFFSVQK